jgi:tRNA G18 (ribose-2'-O)-methylase SpoU
MPDFQHLRHKPPVELARQREIILACPPMRSNVNLSRMVRTAGCCGVRKMIICGPAKIDAKIARDGAEQVELESHRTLAPVLKRLKGEGYELVGLEQTTNSKSLYHFAFPRRSVLVVGHEREGLAEEVLALLDQAVDIPVYGLPYSYNVATAAAMALYEYCRQYPEG